jgi:hypothetical protein
MIEYCPLDYLGARLMAGLMPLEHPVVVRIHCPQPLKSPDFGRFLFNASRELDARGNGLGFESKTRLSTGARFAFLFN